MNLIGLKLYLTIAYRERGELSRTVLEFLASRFRIFRRPIIAEVENVKLVTKATVALHNFLMTSQSNTDNFSYCPVNYVDQENTRGRVPGQWRNEVADIQGLTPAGSQGTHNFTRNAKVVRDTFKEYFNFQEGAVSWQEQVIDRTSNPFDEDY